jgi:glyoxylate reductase
MCGKDGRAVSQGKQRIVVTRKVPDQLVTLLREQQGVEVVMHDSVEPLRPQELVEFVAGAHAIVSIADDKIGAEVFDAAGPDLKIVANYAVGYDNVDISAAVARDVWVTHTVGVENNAVCELTLGVAIALMRGVVLGDRLVREGKFRF